MSDTQQPHHHDTTHWDAYRETLPNSTINTLLTTVTGSTNRETRKEAKQHRNEIQTTYNDITETINTTLSTLEEKINTPETSPETGIENLTKSIHTLEQQQDTVETLLNDREYLTQNEQKTLETLLDEAEKTLRTAKDKKHQEENIQGLTDVLDTIQSQYSEQSGSIPDGDLPHGGAANAVITPEDRDELLDQLKHVKQKLNFLGDGMKTDTQTQLSELRARADDLETAITDHNNDVVIAYAPTVARKNKTVFEDVTELRQEHETAIENGEYTLDEPSDELIERINTRLQDTNSVLKAVECTDSLDREADTGLENTDTGEQIPLGDLIELLEQHVTEFERAKGFVANHVPLREAIQHATTVIHDAETRVNTDEYIPSNVVENTFTDLTEAGENVTQTVEDTPDAVEFLDAEKQRVRGVINRINELREAVKTHNEAFVQQKRDEYSDVFSDMGDDNLSLNEQQEKAVFRNDIHNQINAGAGTGKTFSVACRVKYLIDEGVDPDDIIALTFLREATGEMEERFNDMFGITGVETRTLHSFGSKVLRESDDAPVQLEGEARKREITRLVNALHGEHDEFTEQYDAFRDAYRDEEFDVELTEQRELVTEHRDRDDVLVTGEDIETTNPLIREAHNNIAEWLLVNDVPFEYQAFAEWAGEVGDGDAYTPDFTLCEHDIRIEYLPETSTDGDDEVIDHRAVEHGSDDEEWLSAVEIARIHDDHGKTVIPIDREAVTSGAYREKLRSELREHGVDVTDDVDSIDDVENLGDVVQPAYEAITMERTGEELFGDFIKKAKTNQINAYERMQNAFSSDGESGGESEYDDVFVAFNRAAVILLEAYKQRYDAVNAFDFVDMITEATEEINAGRVSDAVDYKHVIVDEFQDLNLTQIEFIQAVLDYGRETRLFAVGDDWQSIYGFKGARPDYFVNFEEHFAPATQTRLVENYRCPENVVETGNTLIRNNESRTEKTVTAFKDITMEPVVHRVPGSRAVQYENNAVQRARDVIVESVSDDGRDPGDVMVLVRNRAGSRIPGLLRDALGKAGIPVSGDDGVEITTAHGAKGGEAKHVVVMNAAQGRFDGFPAMERERELTSLVSVSSGSHLDEERRLFYVAVTRAEERLDIQTKTGSESRFVREIAAHVDERTHGVDVSRDRVTTAVTVVKTKESEPHWSTKQLGRVETPDGVMMDYAIPDAAGTDRFCEGTAYKVQDVLIDEYEGEPQLVFDEQASVVEMSASV